VFAGHRGRTGAHLRPRRSWA